MTQQGFDTLSVHLEGIHKALLSLARHLQGDQRSDTVRSQLEWSASHLLAAIRELRGEEAPEQPAAPDAANPGSARLLDGLRGHTQAITLPEILGFVASLRKSGVLRVNSREEAFLVQLEDGAVVYAQGDSPPDGQLLGQVLVAQGSLSQADLESVLGQGCDSATILGRKLLDLGLVGKNALCIALSFQVQLLFHRMFKAKDALFQFDEGVELLAADDIRLNVTTLLLESARSTDEEAREDGAWGGRRSA